MYRDSLANTFIRLITLTNWLGCFPFRIDRQKGHAYIHFWSHFRTIHIWSWFTAYIIIVLPTHLYILHDTGQMRRFNFTLIILIGCCTCSILLGIYSFKTKGICQLVNMLFKYLPDFQRKYMSDYDSQLDNFTNNLFEILLLSVYTGCLLIGVMAAMDCAFRPFAAPYLLFSIDPKFVTWPWYLITCGWYGSFAIGFTSGLGLIAYIAVVYFIYGLQIVGRETRMGCKFYKTSDVLRRNPYNLVATWRTVQYLVKVINIEAAFSILYIQCTIIAAFLVAAVTLVYQWSELSYIVRAMMAFIGIFGVSTWCLILTLGGVQYRWSEKTIESWKLDYWPIPKERKYMERVKLACKPFSFGDGKRYYIQPVTVLKFLRSVSRNTFRALITYGEVMGYS